MPDILTRHVNLAISKLRETALNTNYNAANDFNAAVSQSLSFKAPMIEKIFDQGLVGAGDEFARSFINDYISPPEITLSDRINTSQFAVLAARALGGAVTTTELTTGASYKHVIKMQAAGSNPQLPSSSIAAKLGAFNYILAGMVVQSLSMEFTGGGQTTYSCSMVGSGKFESTSMTYPAFVAQEYMRTQAASTLTLNDGSSWNLAGRVRSASFGINNNVPTDDRRLGDSLRTGGDNNSGAYVGSMIHGDRDCTLRLNLYADTSSNREFADHLAGTTITAFTYTATGPVIGATTDKHQVRVIFPKSVIMNVNYEDLNPKLGIPLDFRPLKDSGEPGLITIEIQNGSSSLE